MTRLLTYFLLASLFHTLSSTVFKNTMWEWWVYAAALPWYFLCGVTLVTLIRK